MTPTQKIKHYTRKLREAKMMLAKLKPDYYIYVVVKPSPDAETGKTILSDFSVAHNHNKKEWILDPNQFRLLQEKVDETIGSDEWYGEAELDWDEANFMMDEWGWH